jgi:hypothetical protein
MAAVASLEYRAGHSETSAAEGEKCFDCSYFERGKYEPGVFRLQASSMRKTHESLAVKMFLMKAAGLGWNLMLMAKVWRG